MRRDISVTSSIQAQISNEREVHDFATEPLACSQARSRSPESSLSSLSLASVLLHFRFHFNSLLLCCCLLLLFHASRPAVLGSARPSPAVVFLSLRTLPPMPSGRTEFTVVDYFWAYSATYIVFPIVYSCYWTFRASLNVGRSLEQIPLREDWIDFYAL